MPTDTSVATKTCCACGADVTGQPRMKDSQSRYWCMPCGEADQRRKQLTSTHSLCAACKQPFPKGKLNKHGEYFYCKGCLKKRTSAGTAATAATTGTTVMKVSHAASRSSESGSDNRRALVLGAVLVVLVVFAVLFNVFFAA